MEIKDWVENDKKDPSKRNKTIIPETIDILSSIKSTSDTKTLISVSKY